MEDELLETVYVPEEFIALLPDVPPLKEVNTIQNSLNPCKAPPADKQNEAGLQVVNDFCTLLRLCVWATRKTPEKVPPKALGILADFAKSWRCPWTA